MAVFDSGRSRFFITDADGTERDLSPFIIELSGLPGARSLREVTSLADSGRRFVPAPESSAISLHGVFDDAAGSGPDAILGRLREHSSSTAFTYAPRSDSERGIRYSGLCWVENYSASAAVGSKVVFSATLRVDGTVDRRQTTDDRR